MTDVASRYQFSSIRSGLIGGSQSDLVNEIAPYSQIGYPANRHESGRKDDLLRKSLDLLRGLLLEQWQSSSRGKSPLGFNLPFLRHVDSHRRLYRAIVGRESGMIVDREMRRLLIGLFRESSGVSGSIGKNASRADLAAQYIVGALMSVVTGGLTTL